MLAIIAGPFGLGIYSQLINISSLISVFLPVGGIGLTRTLSLFLSNKEYPKVKYLMKYFIIRNSIASLILVLLVIIFSPQLGQFVFTTSSYDYLIILLAITIPFSLFLNFIDIFFKSIRDINNYVRFIIYNSIVSIVVTYPLIIFFEITGAIIALFLQGFINTLLGIYFIKKINIFSWKILPEKIDKKEITSIYKVGIGVLSILIVQNLSFLLVKSQIASDLGVADVGKFQSIYSISFNYLGIFFTALSIYSIPKFSTFKLKSENNTELNNTLKLLILVFTPSLCIIFVFRTLMITLLFSSEFLSVKDLLFYQLLGDFFRAFSWTFGLWLIPNLKIKQWVIFDLIFYSFFYFSFIIMIKFTNLGLKSVSIAYLASYVIHSFINYFYTVYSMEFKFNAKILKEIITSFIVILLVLVTSLTNESAGYFILFPVLIIWFFVSDGKNMAKQLKEFIIKKG